MKSRYSSPVALWLYLLASIGISGCTLGPDFERPTAQEAGIPDAWHARVPHAGDSLKLEQWWEQFNDPVMSHLIVSAEEQHPSVAGAIASVKKARALLTTTRSFTFPALSGRAAISKSSGSSGIIASLPGANDDLQQESQFLDAGWELDLFGKYRRATEREMARYRSSSAHWHQARVTLAAEVALAYTSFRQCESLTDQFSTELTSRRETSRLTEKKVKAGFSAPADGAQAAASVAEAENRFLDQQGFCQRHLNQLVALTALSHDEMITLLASQSGVIPVPLLSGVPGLPAQVLSQRPDISTAEESLHAASADIGVSIADRLPSLTLAGSIGVNTTKIGNTSDSQTSWSYGPSLSLPIFEAGRRSAAVKAARARYERSMAEYRQTVLSAVQEVEDALVRVDTASRRLEPAQKAVRNYAEFLASAQNRYQHGFLSLLDLENARRLSLSSRQNLAAVQLDISPSWIALYKAAGGGWHEHSNEISPPGLASIN